MSTPVQRKTNYWVFSGDDTLSSPWTYAIAQNGSYVNNHWAITSLVYGGATAIGYVDMGLNSILADAGGLARNQDWLTLSNSVLDTGTFKLNLSGVEYINAPLDKAINLEVVTKEGFGTNGSLNSIRTNVGNHTITYDGATRDSTVFEGSGWDVVNLIDHPDIPGTQYWSLVRRVDGQIDAYSLYSGHRVRLEGGTVTYDSAGHMNYGEIEQINLKNARTGGTENPHPAVTPASTGEKYLDTNIDLRSYESGVNTPYSDSFNLAGFNFIRYTSDNVWTGEATIYDAAVAGRYSAPGSTTVSGATSLDVVGTNRNGTHDLIVAQQANAIDGQLRLYSFTVASGVYNVFNDVYLGTSGGDAKSYSGNGSAAVDRVALYGFDGNDVLTAGASSDYLFGGQSEYNQLVAGAIGNQVTGGAGADYFGVGNTNSAGVVTGSNSTADYGGSMGTATLGYATDVIFDWSAGQDTLVVLSNGVAVIAGLYGVGGMTGNNTIDLRDSAATAISDQNGSGARGGTTSGWDSSQTLQYVYDNQTSRDAQSIENQADITVVNNGLIVARGQAGNDVIYDSAGADYLYGNAGTNVINLSEGGSDRVFFDSRSGKQYVANFSSASGDKFYLAKNVVDAFSGGASKSTDIYDATSNYSYVGGQRYQQGLDYLYGVTYKAYLSNAYGAQPYHNWQHDAMGFAADVTTYVAGAVMIGVGIGLTFIPFVGPALGAPLIAAGTILEIGKTVTQVADWRASNPHHNAVYDLTADATSTFTSNYVYVLHNDVQVNTTVASGSSANADNVNFLDFFSNTNMSDGFTPVLELNPNGWLSGDTFNKSIYGYFAVWSDDETFVYLIASRDNLIENGEAVKVAEINGHLTAADFAVYDSNTDPYNQTADAAVVLRDPTISSVKVGPADTVSVTNGGTTSASSLIVHGTINGALTAAGVVELYDGGETDPATSLPILLGSDTISAGGDVTFAITDSRTLGQLIVQTDYDNNALSANRGNLNPLTMDNTFEYQDKKISYYTTLYNDIGDGIVLATRSSVWTVIDNGPSNATIDGGAGTDTLMLESTSAHLNNASDAQIVSIEYIRVKAPMGAGLQVNVSDAGVVTGVSILDAGANMADGVYALTFNDETTGAEAGAAGTVTVSGGRVTDTHVSAGGSGYTSNAYVTASWVGVGVNIDLHAQTDGFFVIGYTGADTIVGSSGADTLMGGDGSDSLDGSGGADVFIYSDKADLLADATVIGNSGTDTLRLSYGADPLTLTDSYFTHVNTVEVLDLSGNSGAQTITLDTYAQTAGIVSVLGADTTDTVGGTAADTIDASAYTTAITISAGIGNDTLWAGSGVDNLSGGAGNDVFLIDGGADHAAGETITGGDGTDTIRFTSTTAADTLTLSSHVTDSNNLIYVEISNAAGDNTGTTALNVNADALGTDLDVYLTGNDGANTLTGNADANNTIMAGAGNDSLTGGTQVDSLQGDTGNDTITGGGGADSLYGGDGDDVFKFVDSSYLTAAAVVNGGENSESSGDTIYFTTATTIVDSDFGANITAASIENVRLTGASTLTLGANATTAGIAKVYTGTGTTSITKTNTAALTIDATDLANDTTLTVDDSGVTTNMTVTGLTGNLTATNLAGTLQLALANNTSDNDISIALGSANTTITGGDSTDTVTVTGQDIDGQVIDLSGSDANHLITVGSGAQTIISGTGVDTIYTGAGNATTTDRIEFHAGSASANIALTGTDADIAARITSIMDYTEDTLDFTGTDSILASYAGGGGFTTSATGLATFATATTLADKISTLRTALDVNGSSYDSKVVLFNHGADTYAYSCGASGTANDDQIVRIAGDNTLDMISITGSFKLMNAPVVGTPAAAISLLPNTTAWSTGVTTSTPTIFTPAGANVLMNGLGGDAGFGSRMATGDDTYSGATVSFDWDGGAVNGALNMFGTNYSNIYMGTNGYITFGSGFWGYTPSGIAGFTRSPMIAAQYDDLYVGAGARNVAGGSGSGTSTGDSYMYYYGDATKMVFTWNNIGLYSNGSSDSMTSNGGLGSAFQIILWKGVSAGDFGIEIRYEELSQDYSTATAGWTAGDTVNYSLINTANNLYSAAFGSNIGTAGVWGWDVKSGSVEAPYYVPDIGITQITNVAQLTFPAVTSTTPTISETVSVSGDETYGFTMGSPTNATGGETAILSTIATPHWNLWKDRYVDGFANITVTAGGSHKDLSIYIINTHTDTVSRTGNTLVVSATSADLNAANDGDIATVTAASASGAVAGVNMNLSGLTHAVTITGSSHDDTLVGGTGADTITGGSGHDTITAGAGDDVVSMSVAAADIDVANGGDGTDTLTLTGAAAGTVLLDLSVAADADQLTSINGVANAGVQTNFEKIDASVMTGAGIDATAAAGGSSIIGSGQADTLRGGTGSDTLSGGNGNDSIIAGAGSDNIDAGAGNDRILFAIDDLTSADTVDGGDHTSGDTLVMSSVGTLADADLTHVSHVEALELADGSNSITLGSYSEGAGVVSIYGGTGADTISVASYTTLGVTIDAGAGADVLTGGAGNDVFVIDGTADISSGESYSGGGGNDTLSVTADTDFTGITGLTSIETITLAQGVDAIFDAARLTGQTMAINGTGDNGGETLSVNGTAGADTIDLSGLTLDTNDIAGVSITAGSGNDTVTGTSGADTITGGAGVDNLSGGDGNDVFVVSGTSDINGGAETISGGNGNDILSVTADTDFSGLGSLSSIETITLAQGVDVIFDAARLTGQTMAINGTGDNGGETLSVNGTAGADTVNLSGLTLDTNDIAGVSINAGNGNNTVTGTNGADTIICGTGNDTFVYNNTNQTATTNTFALMDKITGADIGDVFNLSGFASYDAGSFSIDLDTVNGSGGDDYIASWTAGGQTYYVALQNTGNTAGFSFDETAGVITLAAAAAPDVAPAAALLTGPSTLTYTTNPPVAGEFKDGTSTITLSMGAIDSMVGWHKPVSFTSQATFTQTVLVTTTTVNNTNPDLVVVSESMRAAIVAAGYTLSSTTSVDLMLDNYLTWTNGGGNGGLAVVTDGVNTYIYADVHYDRSAENLQTVSLDNAAMYQRPLVGARDAQLIMTIAGLTQSSLISVADFVVSGEVILGTSGANSLSGTNGDDGLHGGAGADTLDGGLGDDYLTGDGNSGTAGIDTFVIGSGNDTILDLGFNNLADIIQVSAGASVSATAYGNWTASASTYNDGTATIDGKGKTLDLHLVTTGSNGWYLKDTSTSATSMTGSALNDTIEGGAGADTINGGAGTADIVSYADVTSATSHGLANISGMAINLSGSAVTAATIATAMGGTVVLGGGAGVAGADLAAGSAGYLATTAANSTTTMVRDTLSNLEGVTGSALADYIVGSASADLIDGGAGADVIDGGAGNDIFVYATTASLFSGNALVDSIVGGNNTDTIQIGTSGTSFAITNADSWARSNTIESIKAVANTAAVSVALDVTAETAGIRTVDLSLVTAVAGNVIDASEYTVSGLTLTGSSTGATSITGGAGNDTITGGAGNDIISTGSGTDTVVLGTVTAGGVDVVTLSGTDDLIKFATVSQYYYDGSGDTNGAASLDVAAGIAAAYAAAWGAADSLGDAVAFSYAGNSYIFIDGGTDGYQAGIDAVVQLIGIDTFSLSGANFSA